jgi:hypothetical protein
VQPREERLGDRRESVRNAAFSLPQPLERLHRMAVTFRRRMARLRLSANVCANFRVANRRRVNFAGWQSLQGP